MAATKKSAHKSSAPQKKVSKKPYFNLSEWKKNLKKNWHSNPSFYTLGTIIVVVIVAAALLFWFNKGLFLAGSINGKLITTPEFYSKLSKSSGQEVFDSLVQETLIKQEAVKKGITASDKKIDAKIKELENQLGGKEMLNNTLAQNNTSLDELRGQIVIQILVEELLADKIKVTDKEVQTYIKENVEAAAGRSKEQVKETLESQRIGEEFASWFEELKKKAKINTYFK